MENREQSSKTAILEDLIHLTTLSDNLYLQRQLEMIQEIVKSESNDMLLGEKLRKLL